MKGVAWLAILIALTFGLVAWRKVDVLRGNPDYCRLTSGPRPSLLLGTSRSATGLDSLLITKQLQDQSLALPIYNFSFNLAISPYGPTYLQAIKDKIAERPDKESIFIVTIDPWAVSSEIASQTFPEENRILGKVNRSAYSHKVPFLRDSFRTPSYQAFLMDAQTDLYPFQGNVPIRTDQYSEQARQQHEAAKMRMYRETHFAIEVVDPKRYRFFEETVKLCREKGHTYVVRLPVSKAMRELEEEYAPVFSKTVNETCNELEVEFIDFFDRSGQYLSIDGNHIFGEGVVKLSADLGVEIQRRLLSSTSPNTSTK